jgi:hypothetical protein
MYNSNKNKSNYEGLFAWKPNHVEHGVFGTREVHEKPFSPNIVIKRDIYGSVLSVERAWTNW